MYTIKDLTERKVAIIVTDEKLATELLNKTFPFDNFTTNKYDIKVGNIIQAYDTAVWMVNGITDLPIINDCDIAELHELKPEPITALTPFICS